MNEAIRDAGDTATSARLPENVYSTAQVRGFDRTAIEQAGIPGIELMTRAGHAAFDCLLRDWPAAKRIAVFCGAGNNGGDGFVVARLAREAGLDVEVVLLSAADRLHGDAATAHAQALAAGVTIGTATGAPEQPVRADLVVDALFGTGLARDVEGPYAATIAALNEADVPILALDMPSGIDSDTGQVRGIAIVADATVTFVALKQGLFLGQAPDHCGRIRHAGLGVPADVLAGAAPVMRRLTTDFLRQHLPRRPRMSHKGMNGKVLLVGGSPGMSGAIRLAADAALRGGAGLVRVATHPDCSAQVAAGRPELMCRGVEAPAELGAWLEDADAIVLGPGLGQSEWARSMYAGVIDQPTPLVVDADALNLLAAAPRQRDRWLLTPHPGEAGRLLGRRVADIAADRLGAARALATRYRADVVLKGACSLVAEHSGDDDVASFVCDRGNPGMAGGGMGDVLAGLAGALAAQRRGVDRVGCLATLVHALAGDDAAVVGERGMIAADVIDCIRARVNPR